MSLSTDIHDLSSHMYNLTNLLKFIKEDAVIENTTTSKMLDLAIYREADLLRIMESIKLKSKDIK